MLPFALIGLPSPIRANRTPKSNKIGLAAAPPKIPIRYFIQFKFLYGNYIFQYDLYNTILTKNHSPIKSV